MRRQSPENVWAIVLAAGEGTRMAPLTRALYGHEMPKQFAALIGDRSMLQRTMERAAFVAPVHRTVVVVSEAHESLAREQLAEFPGVVILTQPLNLGTANGILLPVAHIKALDPHARVVIFPSDHHVRRPDRFVEAVKCALSAAEDADTGVALLGAAAERPAVDLGWIVRGGRIGQEHDSAWHVHRFIEKPPEPLAMLLLGTGSLWNTFVIAGSVGALWDLARAHIPKQVRAFEEYLPRALTAESAEARQALYRGLLPADYSREVLQLARGLAVVPVIDSGWFDCGTPERLMEWLQGTPEMAAMYARLQSALARNGARKASGPGAAYAAA